MYTRDDTIRRPNYRFKHVVRAIQEELPDVPKDTIKQVLDAYRVYLLDRLAEGAAVHLLIGSVHLRYAQSIRRYSPKSGQVHDVPPRWRCKLDPGTELKVVMATKPPYEGNSIYMHR